MKILEKAGVPIRELGDRKVVLMDDIIKAMKLPDDIYQRYEAKSDISKKYDNL